MSSSFVSRIVRSAVHDSESNWSETLLAFDDASFYQTFAYGAVRWGESNLEHYYLRENDKVVAAAQIRLIRIPILRSGIAYISWGPLWRRRAGALDYSLLKRAIADLRDEYVSRRRFVLRIRPPYCADCPNDVASILSQSGLALRSDLPRYRTLLLDLSPPLDQLRKQLDQKWRNQLNRAEKNGLEVHRGSDRELYLSYCTIHRDLHARKGYIGSADIEEYEQIQLRLAPRLKLLTSVAVHNGKLVAGMVNSVIGDTGVYVLGATHSEGATSKGSYLLQWQMIRFLKENGHSWYDLGGINPDVNPGVYHFKAGITRDEIVHAGQYELAPSSWMHRLVKFGDRLGSMIRRQDHRKR